MKSARLILCNPMESSSSRDTEIVEDVFFPNANVVVLKVVNST